MITTTSPAVLCGHSTMGRYSPCDVGVRVVAVDAQAILDRGDKFGDLRTWRRWISLSVNAACLRSTRTSRDEPVGGEGRVQAWMLG